MNAHIVSSTHPGGRNQQWKLMCSDENFPKAQLTVRYDYSKGKSLSDGVCPLLLSLADALIL